MSSTHEEQIEAAVTSVLLDSKTKGNARLVLLAIAVDLDTAAGYASPTIARIARRARLSERRVKHYLRALQKAGEIRIRRRVGDASHYILADRYLEASVEKARRRLRLA